MACTWQRVRIGATGRFPRRGRYSNLISLAAGMVGGRFLRSYPYVRQELQIIPLITKCEQNKNGGSRDYNSQPGVQRGQSRFASSTDNSRSGGRSTKNAAGTPQTKPVPSTHIPFRFVLWPCRR